MPIETTFYTLNQMVDGYDPSLDRVFHALADPTRRGMIAQLIGGSRSVSELAAPFASAMSFAGASKHIRVLEDAAIVTRTVQGRMHLFTLNPAALQAVESWMETYGRFWQLRLDALDELMTTGGDQP